LLNLSDPSADRLGLRKHQTEDTKKCKKIKE
jgi:hypothetical protein